MEYISKSDAVALLQRLGKREIDQGHNKVDVVDYTVQAVAEIAGMDSVSTPIDHARWLKDESYIGEYTCSLCGFDIVMEDGDMEPSDEWYFNRCPHCGAIMDEVVTEE